MIETTYKTGQAAQLLRTSSYHIRRLCDLRLIKSEMTPSRQWRISSGEIERLRKEGLPPIPVSTVSPMSGRGPASSDRPGPAGLRQAAAADPPRPQSEPPVDDFYYEFEEDEPSDDEPEVLSPNVQKMKDTLTIAELHKAKRKVELDTEEVEDKFKARESRRLAELEDAKKQREAEQRAARELEEGRANERKRQAWVDAWLTEAQLTIPANCPPDIRLQTITQLHKLLLNNRDLSNRSDAVVRSLLSATIDDCLKPFAKAQEEERAINEALQILPFAARSSGFNVSPWETSARKAAVQAIQQICGDHFSYQDLVAEASTRVRSIAAKFEHQQALERTLEKNIQWWQRRFEATPEERTQAEKDVRQALAEVPVGTGAAILDRMAETALKPLEAVIDRRVRLENNLSKVQQIAEEHLPEIGDWLTENLEYDNVFENFDDRDKYETQLRPILIKRLSTGKLHPDDVSQFISDWMDRATEEEEE